MERGSLLYLTLYGLMILFFSYFWVATQFNEMQIADDMKKSGGYIPGVRPGQATSDFLHRTMSRITLAGAIFLTIIAVIPIILGQCDEHSAPRSRSSLAAPACSSWSASCSTPCGRWKRIC